MKVPVLYFYGMKARGYSPGAQPRRVYERRDDASGKYFDIIAYPVKLSEYAIGRYDLDFIGKEVRE